MRVTDNRVVQVCGAWAGPTCGLILANCVQLRRRPASNWLEAVDRNGVLSEDHVPLRTSHEAALGQVKDQVQVAARHYVSWFIHPWARYRGVFCEQKTSPERRRLRSTHPSSVWISIGGFLFRTVNGAHARQFFDEWLSIGFFVLSTHKHGRLESLSQLRFSCRSCSFYCCRR